MLFAGIANRSGCTLCSCLRSRDIHRTVPTDNMHEMTQWFWPAYQMLVLSVVFEQFQAANN